MKKLLLPLLLAVPLTVLAGEKGVQGDSDKPLPPHFARLMERLDLTEDQSHQLREIFQEHRQQMRSLREQTEQRIDTLLTADQRGTMQAMKEQRAEKRRDSHEKKEGRKDGPPGEKKHRKDAGKHPHHSDQAVR